MELQHINVKVFVDGDLPVDPARFIDVFHGMIQKRSLEELLIDVADYRHVPAGPGVLLVAHEADYSMDHADDRWGLRYNRKEPLPGSNVDRFEQAFRRAVHVCGLLEEQFSAEGLKFNRRELELFVNDRALAPNTPETFQACKPDIETFLKERLGQNGFTLEHADDARRRFTVYAKLDQPFE